MRLQALLQGGACTMQPHHRVVRREAEVRRDTADRDAIDDDPTQDHRIVRLQLFCLDQDAPAVDPIIGYGRELELICRQDALWFLSELVE